MEMKAGATATILWPYIKLEDGAGLLEHWTKIKQAWVCGGIISAMESIHPGFMLYESVLLKWLLFEDVY